MTDFDNREYNTVVLAALLHDVGKLLHRGTKKPRYKCKHEAASGKFIEYFRERLTNDSFYDIELVRLLVRCHDKDITKTTALNDRCLQGKSETYKKRVWKMIRLVRIADGYSCSEREIGKLDRERALPLESVFSYLSLGTAKELSGRYRLNCFTPANGFPAHITTLSDDDLDNFIELFEKAVENEPHFSAFQSFEDVIMTWLNLLHNFMWAVPSDTRYKNDISDISLFDHSRSTAAIAACLYRRHLVALNKGRNLESQDEFILIGGDFSGIQKYIFEITSKGSGGASKRLRARSFFIYLFTEAVIHKILHELELPFVCNVFSAGGKFLLFAPNIDGIAGKLQTVKRQVETEIHKTYFSQFAFLMSWMPINRFRAGLGIKRFFETAALMFHRLESEKVSKSSEVLVNEHGWNTETFGATELYESYKGSEDCPICGKGPANLIENIDDDGESIKCCFLCLRDKTFIGRKIPKCNYVAFAKGPVTKDEENGGDKIVLFRSGGDRADEFYYVELLKEYTQNEAYYLIYNIGDLDDAVHGTGLVPAKKYYANYVFVRDDKVETFEALAEMSRWKKGDSSRGSDMLGVLKADIDNLGVIFSKGFEVASHSEETLRAGDRKTVSRFLTLSRMLELFFSGWIKEAMADSKKDEVIGELTSMAGIDKERFTAYLSGEQIDFSRIYTVYSGGDDLVLVGPWETMIIFAIYLNHQFRRYTCNNDDITLSAGLSFIKPKQPIAWGIRRADELLNLSKERGKDRITLFGTTVKWDKIPMLLDAFLFFDEKLNDTNSNINSAFLNRLLGYHQMAARYFDDKQRNIDGLKYISALNYDIGRNIVEWDKDGGIKKGRAEFEFLQKLVPANLDDKSLMHSVKIPLFWTLLRNRRAKE